MPALTQFGGTQIAADSRPSLAERPVAECCRGNPVMEVQDRGKEKVGLTSRPQNRIRSLHGHLEEFHNVHSPGKQFPSHFD